MSYRLAGPLFIVMLALLFGSGLAYNAPGRAAHSVGMQSILLGGRGTGDSDRTSSFRQAGVQFLHLTLSGEKTATYFGTTTEQKKQGSATTAGLQPIVPKTVAPGWLEAGALLTSAVCVVLLGLRVRGRAREQ
jgi:hypothetical protein